MGMASIQQEHFRIGELARRVGSTPRAVRHYEELGLLPDRGRPTGRHRLYDARDEARLRELLQMRDLLGLSLADLRAWSEAEAARAGLRARWHEFEPTEGERAEILREALGHVETQLELVRSRREALEGLEDELTAKRRRVRELMAELEDRPA
jgi:MerR family transcriptional regulator, repressor of the yfmOP operon